MNPQETQRFEFIRQGGCVPVEYVRDYYGLTWPMEGDVSDDYEAWRSQLRRPSNCNADCVSRYEIEAFMQQKGVVPKEWMGARLGMKVASLDELLARLRQIGMRAERYLAYTELVAETLSEDLVLNLPGLRFRTFSDHNSFCERLHEELAQQLGIAVQKLFCATSDRVQEYPRQYASNFDCITLSPLSGKHQLWLDFRKPLNLGPDRCSKLFYAENLDLLGPYRAGTRNRDPDDIEEYVQFLAEHTHG
jgi:hypothetical protein